MNLIENLKKGNIPDYLLSIAEDEEVEVGYLVENIIKGRIVVPKNAFREIKKPCAIGKGLTVKVNANIGTSSDYADLEDEIRKLEVAVNAGAHTVMDLSTGGDLVKVRTAILEKSPVPVGTVPIYEAAVRSIERNGSIVEMSEDEMIKAIEEQAKQGVDFMTIHAGVSSRTIKILERKKRVLGVVSRGGSFLVAWMLHNQRENPLLERFDEVLEILRMYDVTLSLGDGLRPGCLEDATDEAQIDELFLLGDLVKRAREANVQVMVEGPGHVPLNQIEANVILQKRICDEAPFYVLGPLPTDSAPGYDHIVSAIGGALAAYHGADFLCYVTPREHLGLPDEKDVYDGVSAARIAAHIADIARGNKKAILRDSMMARARANLDWEGQISCSLVPEKTKKMLLERSAGTGACTMCGPFCAIEIVKKHLGTDIDVC
ncbi:MAG: phosphomethylpyrimidine synthase ThiC [Actinobacteria bacterium]|nr:phosphomethylpyrimidine synthase ThiC [Actinomycetota bacterium]